MGSVFISVICTMYYIIPGIIIFFASVLFARFQNEKAMKSLSTQQTGELVQSMSKTRMTSMWVLMAIIVSFLMASYFLKIDKMVAMIGYFIAIIGFYSFSAFLALKQAKDLQFPQTYIQYSLRAAYIRLAGLVVFVILLGYGLAQNLEKVNL